MTLDQALRDAVAEAVAPLERRLRDLQARLEHTLPPQFVSVMQAAELLGCARCTVDEMVKRGELTPKRVGRRVLIDVAQLRVPSREDVGAEVFRARRAGGR